MAERWAHVPIVTIPVARCPRCSSAGAVRVRSVSQPDGAVDRLRVCRSCSARYIERIDPSIPVSGMLAPDIP